MKLFLIFCFFGSFAVTFSQLLMDQSAISAVQGDQVILRASYSASDAASHAVVWNLVKGGGASAELVVSRIKGSIGFGSPRFRGRVGFLDKMAAADVSIYINNTQEEDSGRYVCQIIVPNGDALTGETTLDVKVPPEAPKCSLAGRALLKGNVTMLCSSGGKPTPTYRWRKTKPTSEVFFSPMADERIGSLKLAHLASNASGRYVCTASNAVGSLSCSLDLEVIAPANAAGVIAGAAVGSLLGVACLLAVAVAAATRRRWKKSSGDEPANEIREDAAAPKRVSWATSDLYGPTTVMVPAKNQAGSLV